MKSAGTGINLYRLNLFVFHKAGFAKLHFQEINGGYGAAQEPACGICHGNGNDLIANMGHDKQVCLPEQDKGTQHN